MTQTPRIDSSMATGMRALIERYIEDRTEIGVTPDGHLWAFSPGNDGYMQWVCFDGFMVDRPWRPIWTRLRSDKPDGFRTLPQSVVAVELAAKHIEHMIKNGGDLW